MDSPSMHLEIVVTQEVSVTIRDAYSVDPQGKNYKFAGFRK